MGFVSNYTQSKYRPRQIKPGREFSIPNQFVGLEFEVERPGFNPRFTHFEAHRDGSLRNGIEYVTNGAKSGDSLAAAIEEFYGDTSWYEITPRCGLHVHIDMTQEEDTLDSTISFLGTYYILEDLFFAFAGEFRRTMGFCYPLSEDWTFLSSVFREYAQYKKNKNSVDERDMFAYVVSQNRYFAFNPQSLQRHGTFEFRHLEMTRDKSALYRWIDLIFATKKLACSSSIEQIVDDAISNPEKYATFGHQFGVPFNPDFIDSVKKRATSLLGFLTNNREFKVSLNTNPLFKNKEVKKTQPKVKKKEAMLWVDEVDTLVAPPRPTVPLRRPPPDAPGFLPDPMPVAVRVNDLNEMFIDMAQTRGNR